MKRKVCILLAAAMLLGSATLAEAENGNESKQPRIFDTLIIISLAERNMEISFRYEEVAGNIDDAKKMIVIGTISATGDINVEPIPLKAADPRGKEGDGITPSVMTQGRAKYYVVIPDTLDLSHPEEIFAAAVAVVDGLGRKAEAVFIDRQIAEEEDEPRKIGI